jgi:hypothetical protein
MIIEQISIQSEEVRAVDRAALVTVPKAIDTTISATVAANSSHKTAIMAKLQDTANVHTRLTRQGVEIMPIEKVLTRATATKKSEIAKIEIPIVQEMTETDIGNGNASADPSIAKIVGTTATTPVTADEIMMNIVIMLSRKTLSGEIFRLQTRIAGIGEIPIILMIAM